MRFADVTCANVTLNFDDLDKSISYPALFTFLKSLLFFLFKRTSILVSPCPFTLKQTLKGLKINQYLFAAATHKIVKISAIIVLFLIRIHLFPNQYKNSTRTKRKCKHHSSKIALKYISALCVLYIGVCFQSLKVTPAGRSVILNSSLGCIGEVLLQPPFSLQLEPT